MRGLFGRGLWALVLLWGCESLVGLQPEVPGEVAWLAAAAIDPDTDLVSSSTHLQPVGDPFALAHDDSHDLWLLGFDADPVEELRSVVKDAGFDFEALVKSAPLGDSHPCLERLPPPVWGRFTGASGAARETAPAELPRFRAPWLFQICKQLPLGPNQDSETLSPLSLEVNGRFCGREALRQTGCELEFRWDLCGAGGVPATKLRLEWDQRMCPEAGPACTQVELDPRHPAATTFRCEIGGVAPTELRIHRPEPTVVDEFVRAEHVRVFKGDLVDAPDVVSAAPEVLNTNHLSAILELEGEIVVSTHLESRAG